MLATTMKFNFFHITTIAQRNEFVDLSFIGWKRNYNLDVRITSKLIKISNKGMIML